jgi:Cu(I)/Ag(I) efflux system protein CusF
MKRITTSLTALLALSIFSAFAQAPLPQTEGEVRNIDKTAGKITLKHGEIKNLGMPPMAMVFKAKDPALLDKVKAGDKVRFTADQVNGTLTLVSIEPSK